MCGGLVNEGNDHLLNSRGALKAKGCGQETVEKDEKRLLLLTDMTAKLMRKS